MIHCSRDIFFVGTVREGLDGRKMARQDEFIFSKGYLIHIELILRFQSVQARSMPGRSVSQLGTRNVLLHRINEKVKLQWTP